MCEIKSKYEGKIIKFDLRTYFYLLNPNAPMAHFLCTTNFPIRSARPEYIKAIVVGHVSE